MGAEAGSRATRLRCGAHASCVRTAGIPACVRQKKASKDARDPHARMRALPYSQRTDDSSILILSESLQRLSADVSLRAESERGLRVSLVVRRLDDGDQVVSAHCQVSILQ